MSSYYDLDDAYDSNFETVQKNDNALKAKNSEQKYGEIQKQKISQDEKKQKMEKYKNYFTKQILSDDNFLQKMKAQLCQPEEVGNFTLRLGTKVILRDQKDWLLALFAIVIIIFILC